MNVLILTPDRVGSTLLQRLISVYANLNENYQPLTINLHELTNGLVFYQNDHFKRKILGKKDGGWGYHQSLESIVGLISNCGHDVVSRLAFYHLRNRQDSINDQLAFYQYLNDNFFIIAARRQNLFEHALSWAISVESKKLNVYSAQEKFQVYQHITKNKIFAQQDVIKKYLDDYMLYIEWVDRHFRVNSYFEYERDLPNIEDYILTLNVFRSHKSPLTWFDRFGISWTDWNHMHYLLSLVPFDYHFSIEEKKFMSDHIELYTQCRIIMQDLQDQGVLVSGIPIKLHTLHEKSNLISNIENCLLTYNQWASSLNQTYTVTYDAKELNQIAYLEHDKWTRGTDRSMLTEQHVSRDKLLLSDLRYE